METKEVFDIEEIDVEECLGRGDRVPRARRYVIRVDKQRVISHKGHLTGAEILALVNKTPEGYKLYQHKKGHQPTLVRPDEVVDLTEHGIERFTTMPKDTTEGLNTGGARSVRREFQLPEGDTSYITRLGTSWETLNDGGTLWLFLHNWNLPQGYNHPHASVALLIPANYPDTQLDMVYFLPALSRADGKPIAALSTQTIAGETWQRWSRHRTAANPWWPTEDDLASHLGLVDEWLRREFERT
jgi:hypothetical protein